MKNNKKIIVIGLDGATWDLLDIWIKDGKLPEIKKLMDNGIYSILNSTIPSYTLPAWTSSFTGVNPGKHNIFDLLVENQGNKRLISSKDRKAKTIFEILSLYDKVSVVVNIPGTFPPDKINGVMISGTLTTPSIDDDFIYPKSLHKEFSPFFKESFELDYRMLKYLSATNKDEFLNLLNRSIDKEVEATIELSKRYKPDLIWYVFRTTDLAKHYLYDSKDPNSRNHGYLLKHYQKVDLLVNKILENNSKNSSIFLISDHGFAPLKNYIYINTWLEKQNYLKKINRKKGSILFKKILESGDIFINFTSGKNKIFDKILLKIFKTIFLTNAIENRISENIIDFSKTTAYSPSYTSQAIKIIENDENKKNEIINDIISKLYQLKDQNSGEKVIEKIYKREDVYSGAYTKYAPHILITTKEGYILTSIFSSDDNSISKPPSILGGKTGDHRPDGIFIASGKHIKKAGKINSIDIVDIPATILSILQVPIPGYMDGKALERSLVEYKIISESSRYIDEKERIADKIQKLRKIGRI